MTGPLTAVRRLTSTATGLVGTTVRTGVGVASTAVHGALHLVTRDGGGRQESGHEAGQETGQGTGQAPEPVRVPTPPDPAVKVARQQAEASAGSTARKPARKTARKAPSAKAATTAPAQAARAAKAGKASTQASPQATPKPAPPRKKASEVPLKSDPTPASAAPPEPEGPDVRPGDGGATGHAEAEPLLEPGVAAQVRAESEQLRSAAE